MYTKQEAKQLRKDYWDQFKTWSGYLRIKKGRKGRWLMNDTGIRQIQLKFHFDEHFAFVGIVIHTRNLEKRLELWQKLENLQNILEQKADFPIRWEKIFMLHELKQVSGIYSSLESVTIYNRDDWKTVNDFFYKRMTLFEDFFLEYRDYLKYQ